MSIGPLTRWHSLEQDQQLRIDLPHLYNVFDASPDVRSRISVYDFDGDQKTISQRYIVVDYDDNGESESDVAAMLPLSSKQVSTCIMIVEDISSNLIKDLTNLLDISLEVFEDHLLDGGWDNSTSHPDPDPLLWNSKRVGRSHFSISWPRPYRANCAGYSLSISDRVLTLHDLIENDEMDDSPDPGKFSWRYRCNTWRQHLNFETEFWTSQPRESFDIMHKTKLAVDERMTLWQGVCGTSRLLLIPTDSGFACDTEIVSEREKESNPLYRIRDKNKKQKLNLRNLFRDQAHTDQQGDHEATSTLATVGSSPQLSLSEMTRQSTHSNPNVVSEATGVIVEAQIMESPQPSGAPSGALSEISTSIGNSSSTTFQTANTSIETVNSIRNPPAASTPPITDNLLSTNEQAMSPDLTAIRPNLVSRKQIALRNVASRCPVDHINLDQARAIGAFFSPLTSTREDICQWIQTISADDIVQQTKTGVASLIYVIFHHDSMDFLQFIETYLDEVIGVVGDEVEVEKNINLWRKQLHHLDVKSRRIQAAAPKFASFLSKPEPSLPSNTQGTIDLEAMAEELLNRISEIRKHLQMTNTLIASSISVAESRRGISEAESVTKLTELAFIYVPLSFAATFFSMQVKELNQETTSITGFVGLALGVVLSSYAVRLLIRSQPFIHMRARVANGIPWTWHRTVTDQISFAFGNDYHESLATIAVVVSALIVMISVWASSSLVPSMKLAISMAVIILFIFLMGLACVFNFQALKQIAKALQRQRQRHKSRRRRRKSETQNVQA